MDLRHTPVRDLAAACRRETDRFRRGEPSSDGYCFELFRRAICDRNEAAWEAIVGQYRAVVLTWVVRQGATVAEQADYWVNRTFDRFWSAIPAERFGMFQALPHVLKYLQLCAASAVLDERRTQRASAHESLETLLVSGPEPGRDRSTTTDVESSAVEALSGRELWQTIVHELPDAAERTVVYCSFVLGMKPAEIHQRRPDLFGTVADVYRIKRNVLERLRRSPAIQRLAGEGPKNRSGGRSLD